MNFHWRVVSALAVPPQFFPTREIITGASYVPPPVVLMIALSHPMKVSGARSPSTEKVSMGATECWRRWYDM